MFQARERARCEKECLCIKQHGAKRTKPGPLLAPPAGTKPSHKNGSPGTFLPCSPRPAAGSTPCFAKCVWGSPQALADPLPAHSRVLARFKEGNASLTSSLPQSPSTLHSKPWGDGKRGSAAEILAEKAARKHKSQEGNNPRNQKAPVTKYPVTQALQQVMEFGFCITVIALFII